MRMLMIGKYATRSAQHPQGQLPFTNIYLHGLIRDQKGQKMSKSKGNVINFLEIIDQFGADALRMAMVIRSSAGLDKSVSLADFKAMRNLGNKIWNAARYVLENSNAKAETRLKTVPTTSRSAKLDPHFMASNQYHSKLASLVIEITKHLESLK